MPEMGTSWGRFEAGVRIRLAVIGVALFLPAIATAQVTPPAPPGADATPADFSDLAERLSSSVVNISTSQTLRPNPSRGPDLPQLPEDSPLQDFFDEFLDRDDGSPRRVTSLGSGFLIDNEGFVVTNNHVIEDADEISVILNDGITTLPAQLIGTDEKTDLALLKVDSTTPLPHATFGDSDTARVGQWVVAIGNPFGLGGTVTAGIISARNRYINAGDYDDFIQTDASINRGNSGGPLFNMNGEVIGVNSAIYSPTGGSVGIGFAIPSNEVRHVVAQLKESGRVSRGMIGVRIQAVSPEIADSLDLPAARGALVSGVTEGGPAAAAGIQEGDVIVSFDGRPVQDDRTLPRIVAETEVGTRAEVEIVRNGQTRTLEVVVARLPDDEVAAANDNEPLLAGPAAEDSTRLGLTLEALTPYARDQYNIDGDVEGVLVIDVEINGPLGDKVQPGDVLMEVAREIVLTPEEVEAKIDSELAAGRSAVLLLIHREGEQSYLGVRIAP
jgi:serine protease Do